MTEECEECGKEFDSERGLHIHQAQKHENEEDEQTEDEQVNNTQEVERAPKTNSDGISLSTEQFGGLTFMTGLFLGIILGGLLFGSSLTGNIGMNGAPSPSADQGNTDTNSEHETVDLDSTGIGTEEMSFTWSGGEVNLSGTAFAGNEDAETVIVSYEDFTCGYCGRHNRETFPTIAEDYINSGEVQYFYKHFPVLGGWNRDGSVAAECAADQNSEAFWDMKNYLYQNQNNINTGNVDSIVKDYASEIGLDTEEFNSCYDNQETMDKVDADLSEGRNFNHSAGGSSFVSATPSFLVYDRETGEAEAVVGAQPVQAFREAIEQ